MRLTIDSLTPNSMNENQTLGLSADMPNSTRNALRKMQMLSSRIAILNEITELINRNLNEAQILQTVRQYSKWLLDYDHLSVTLAHPDGGWKINTLSGEMPLKEHFADNDANTIAQVITSQRTKIIDSGMNCSVFPKMHSLICIPLTSDDEVIGTLNFAQHRENAYALEDVRVAYLLALQLTSGLRNAAQLDRLRRAEESLRQYAHQLELRNDELDWFNAMIAHDLKAPLSVIYGYISLLEMVMDTKEREEGMRYTRLIFDAAQGMNTMILRLLEMTRVQQTKQPHPVNINTCINKTLGRFKPQMDRYGAPFSFHVQPNMPQVIGYDVWIEEILANLISNAIKYIGDKNASPSIEIAAYEVDDKKGTIRVEVRDNGIGIEAENLDKVYARFERAGGKGEGHGLGLFIVNRFVSQLGGTVGVDSEKGVGSVFWFTLTSA